MWNGESNQETDNSKPKQKGWMSARVNHGTHAQQAVLCLQRRRALFRGHGQRKYYLLYIRTYVHTYIRTLCTVQYRIPYTQKAILVKAVHFHTTHRLTTPHHIKSHHITSHHTTPHHITPLTTPHLTHVHEMHYIRTYIHMYVRPVTPYVASVPVCMHIICTYLMTKVLQSMCPGGESSHQTPACGSPLPSRPAVARHSAQSPREVT